jgi:NAD(P)H-nitrite reductase large subunit
MRYVVVGNSYAGIGAVESIREMDKEGEITIISHEPYYTYTRPLISHYLGGHVTEKNMYYRPRSFYEKNKIRPFLGKRAVEIHTKNQLVYLEDETGLEYDKLLISTGGQSIIPPIQGLGAKDIFSFMTWNDAKKIRKLARVKKKAIVIGGGLIGLKAAEGLNDMGLKVTIIELGPRILAMALDEGSGKVVSRQLKKSGITCITGHTAKEILSNAEGSVCGIILDDGRKLDCEILIIAIGVRPNVDLIKNTRVHINNGIVVDRYMETNIKNIYAAGDVAEARDILNNRDSVIAIAPLAYEQGRIAGYNMTGRQRLYTGGIGMNSIDVYNLPVMTIGLTSPINDRQETRTFRKGNVYRKLVLEGNRLVGAILVGDVDYGGILTHLIRSQTDIKDEKKELIDHGLKTGEFVSAMIKREINRTSISAPFR